MNHRIPSAALAATLIALTANPAAAASSQEAVNMCRAALTENAEEGTKFKFKSMTSGRKRTVTFIAKNGDNRETVDCIVRRGNVFEIVWEDGGERLAAK